MALDETQQLSQLASISKHVLLVVSSNHNPDAICGVLALKKILEKQHKQADIVAEKFTVPQNLKFLKGIEQIQPQISHLQKFIIKIDLSNIKIDTLSYDIKDNWLSIYLTPKQGIITKNDIRTAQSNFKYDLIIVVGAQDLESLGNVFFNNTDLFYRVPVVNIDNHPANEHFGQINIVDITATSSCEILFKKLSQMADTHIDEDTATDLLTGMISQTQSFKTPNVTPATLHSASQLMNLGADREKIVQNLYRTRTISALKIWGQALTHMESQSNIGLVWTSITREDFARSGAAEEDLKGLIDELLINSPEAKVVILLYEKPHEKNGGIRGLIYADKQHDAKQLVQTYHAEGNKKTAAFTVKDKTLKEAENEVVGVVRQGMRSKL